MHPTSKSKGNAIVVALIGLAGTIISALINKGCDGPNKSSLQEQEPVVAAPPVPAPEFPPAPVPAPEAAPAPTTPESRYGKDQRDKSSPTKEKQDGLVFDKF